MNCLYVRGVGPGKVCGCRDFGSAFWAEIRMIPPLHFYSLWDGSYTCLGPTKWDRSIAGPEPDSEA